MYRSDVECYKMVRDDAPFLFLGMAVLIIKGSSIEEVVEHLREEYSPSDKLNERIEISKRAMKYWLGGRSYE